MYYNGSSSQTERLIPTSKYSAHADIDASVQKMAVLSFKPGCRYIGTRDVVVLQKPVIFSLEQDEEGFYADNDKLNIHAYGKNTLELHHDIINEIRIQWELYANEPDENLTLDAQKLKNALRANVSLKESFVNYYA